jgi:hypothetical protein
MEDYQTISDPGTMKARALKYGSMKVTEEVQPNAQWSDWELFENTLLPGAVFSDLNGAYRLLLEAWTRERNTGAELEIMPGTKGVRILAVLNNRSTPFWFDNDGGFHSFYKLYAIRP